MSNVIDNYKAISECVAGRAEILAVSKFQSIDQMRELADYLLAQGEVVTFGESYVQEYQKKKPNLPKHHVHMIGRMQRNKADLAVELFDVIESVHSLKLAEALEKAAEKAEKVQDIYLQVNISDDDAKAGILVTEFNAVYSEVKTFQNLNIKGLMTITRDYENIEDVRGDFKKMFDLKRSITTDQNLVLSMGMSHDYLIAIEEGATEVRIGSALFGAR